MGIICLQYRRPGFDLQEAPLEKGMVTHSSILAWRIPLTQEPGGLQSMGSQRVRRDCMTNTLTFHGEFKWVKKCLSNLLTRLKSIKDIHRGKNGFLEIICFWSKLVPLLRWFKNYQNIPSVFIRLQDHMVIHLAVSTMTWMNNYMEIKKYEEYSW